jgi:hypothetical protein
MNRSEYRWDFRLYAIAGAFVWIVGFLGVGGGLS